MSKKEEFLDALQIIGFTIGSLLAIWLVAILVGLCPVRVENDAPVTVVDRTNILCCELSNGEFMSGTAVAGSNLQPGDQITFSHWYNLYGYEISHNYEVE